MKRILVFLACFLVVHIISFGQEKQPDELLKNAIYQEEVKGNLEEAILIYKDIIKNYPEQRALAAEALFHLGLSNEKLGNKKAKEYYETLVNSFGDQPKYVRFARERLSKLLVDEGVLKDPLVPKFTKIKIPTKLWAFVALSPDGRDLALVSDDKLWKLPVTGNLGYEYPGIPVQLNTENIKVEPSGISWSGDGKWIAFNNEPQPNENSVKIPNQSIYRIPSNGGKPYEIVNNYRGSAYLNYRISLSPDGKNLAYTSIENNEQHIYTKPVTGGTPKQLADITAREPVFSPDGKWIAYVEDKNLGKDGGDLWVKPADGGVPKLIAKAGKASSPVWSPDGKKIAFLDHHKNKLINLISIPESDEATSKVTSIEAPPGIEGLAILAGWTPDNKIGMLATTNRKFALFTVPSEGGQAAMIMNDESWVYQPRWSPDGKQIYYTTAPGMGIQQGLRLRLASVSGTGGNAELFPLLMTNDGDTIRTITYQGGNRVSPDGKMLISSAWTSKDLNPSNPYYPNLKIWKFASDGSERIQLTNKSGNYADFCPCWSPDGEKVAFIRCQMTKRSFLLLDYDEAGIYIIDSSGKETEILPYSADKFFYSLVWSPDGKMLAYFTMEKEAPNRSYINVLDLETGKSKVIKELPSVNQYMELAWSPDSRRIGYNGEGIKVVNIDNGNTEGIETNLLDLYIYDMDWSPDGKRFVFGGLIVPKFEFWFLEDFLPLDKLAKNQEGLISESEGITIKQVWTGGDVDDMGQVSGDGKLLSFVDKRTADLAIRDLKTKENRILTNEGSWAEPYHFADVSLITDDGKRIIYSWYNDDGNYDLRSLKIGDPSPEIIYKPANPEQIFPKLLYYDDRKVFVQRFYPEDPWYLASVNINNGEITNLKDFRGNYPINLSMSPDKKYIAFDFPNINDKGRFDIHLLSLDGKEELPLIVHPANDRLLGWLPGRNEMLFTSDRSGTTDVWALNTSGQNSANEPENIFTNIGDINPMGFAENGTLFFSTTLNTFNAFSVPFDEKTGKLSMDSRKPLFGSILDPIWTNDGESLICVEQVAGKNITWKFKLSVLDNKTGAKGELAANIHVQGTPRFSPDGNSVLFFGRDESKMKEKDYKGGIYSVDLNSGIASEIKVSEDVSRSYSVDWDKEGKSIFYMSNNKIISHNIETGEERILYENKNLSVMSILKRSWEGDHLLFDVQENDTLKQLKSIPVEGGEDRILCSFKQNVTHNLFKRLVLSPDGNYIYFILGPTLWRIPKDGGNKELLWSSKDNIAGLDIHPDGNELVFSVYTKEKEIRAIENLASEIDKIFSQTE